MKAIYPDRKILEKLRSGCGANSLLSQKPGERRGDRVGRGGPHLASEGSVNGRPHVAQHMKGGN